MGEQKDKKTCFVAAPIGEKGSPVRLRSDQVLAYVIEPALEACGYNPLRADHMSDPGIINSQVIRHLVEDPLVIADLTGQNPNVYYEVAVRHATGKPIIQVIAEGEKIPFDLRGMRILGIGDLDKPSNSKEAIKQIKRAIEAIEKNPDQMDTPISLAIGQKRIL